MKAFKYFDLNDNGTVEPEEFAKAIEKIGIQIPTKQVSQNPSKYSKTYKIPSSFCPQSAYLVISRCSISRLNLLYFNFYNSK